MKPKKRAEKLERRRKDYDLMMSRHFADAGKEGRRQSGGFIRPGSLK